MRAGLLLVAGFASLLASCDRSGTVDASHHRGGRYEGIGIATPGESWSKIADAPKPDSDKAATVRDDDYLIFVTDTQTGEVRECGDHSGFCVKVQPWAKDAPSAPLALTDHRKSGAGETVEVTNDTAGAPDKGNGQ